jgi:hypothetical protein
MKFQGTNQGYTLQAYTDKINISGNLSADYVMQAMSDPNVLPTIKSWYVSLTQNISAIRGSKAENPTEELRIRKMKIYSRIANLVSSWQEYENFLFAIQSKNTSPLLIRGEVRNLQTQMNTALINFWVKMDLLFGNTWKDKTVQEVSEILNNLNIHGLAAVRGILEMVKEAMFDVATTSSLTLVDSINPIYRLPPYMNTIVPPAIQSKIDHLITESASQVEAPVLKEQ